MLRTVSFPIEWERLSGLLTEPVFHPWNAYAARVSKPGSMKIDYDGPPATSIDLVIAYPHPSEDADRVLPSPLGLIAVEARYGNPKRFTIEAGRVDDACAGIARLIDGYLAYCRQAAGHGTRALNLYAGRAIRWQWDDIARYLGYGRASN